MTAPLDDVLARHAARSRSAGPVMTWDASVSRCKTDELVAHLRQVRTAETTGRADFDAAPLDALIEALSIWWVPARDMVIELFADGAVLVARRNTDPRTEDAWLLADESDTTWHRTVLVPEGALVLKDRDRTEVEEVWLAAPVDAALARFVLRATFSDGGLITDRRPDRDEVVADHLVRLRNRPVARWAPLHPATRNPSLAGLSALLDSLVRQTRERGGFDPTEEQRPKVVSTDVLRELRNALEGWRSLTEDTFVEIFRDGAVLIGRSSEAIDLSEPVAFERRAAWHQFLLLPGGVFVLADGPGVEVVTKDRLSEKSGRLERSAITSAIQWLVSDRAQPLDEQAGARPVARASEQSTDDSDDAPMTWDASVPLHEVLAIVARIVASVREIGAGGRPLDVPVQAPSLPWVLSRALLAQDVMPFVVARQADHAISISTPPDADVAFTHRIVLSTTDVTWTTTRDATGESRTTVGSNTPNGLAWALGAAVRNESAWF